MPFIASWPGTLPGNKVSHQPVISLDAARTALAVGHADPGAKSKLDGVNLVPFLKVEVNHPPHKALFWRKNNGVAWAVRSGNLKLLSFQGLSKPALYDLKEDVGEEHNIAAAHPEKVKELQSMFDTWNQSNLPPFFPSYRAYHEKKNGFYRELLNQQ